MARLFFILVGGVEMSLGSLVTLYILGIFPKQPSQLNGALVTSTFWAGVLITRLVCTFSIRMATSPRVMQMLLLAASALCGYAALFPSTTLHAICLQLFLIGKF
ncbi:unnamed protein product, partial [Anisakis simplex]|uniref:MFS_1_like domain-containing protein n=1 Tax=Anisakis simplex TaxID=6269 RepID=A0A0M3JN30_ANISI